MLFRLEAYFILFFNVFRKIITLFSAVEIGSDVMSFFS